MIKYSVVPYPKIRRATIGVLNAAKRKNMIHSLIEVDISKAREELSRFKRDKNNYLSFTAYIIYCVSKTVDENKIMHAYRNRRSQLVLFDEIDVSTTIERKIDGRSEVVAKIIRAANRKSLAVISKEIKDEKEKMVDDTEVFRSMKLFLSIPSFVRQLVFRLLDKSPSMMKKRAGTIMVTSTNMIGGAAWGIPIATHTLNVAIGAIVERVVERKRQFEKRQHLCLTLSFDHNIIDGAPAARFVRNLKRLIESGEINMQQESERA